MLYEDDEDCSKRPFPNQRASAITGSPQIGWMDAPIHQGQCYETTASDPPPKTSNSSDKAALTRRDARMLILGSWIFPGGHHARLRIEWTDGDNVSSGPRLFSLICCHCQRRATRDGLRLHNNHKQSDTEGWQKDVSFILPAEQIEADVPDAMRRLLVQCMTWCICLGPFWYNLLALASSISISSSLAVTVSAGVQ